MKNDNNTEMTSNNQEGEPITQLNYHENNKYSIHCHLNKCIWSSTTRNNQVKPLLDSFEHYERKHLPDE